MILWVALLAAFPIMGSATPFDEPAPPAKVIEIARRLESDTRRRDLESGAAKTTEEREATLARWYVDLGGLFRDGVGAAKAQPDDPGAFDLLDRLIAARPSSEDEVRLRDVLYYVFAKDSRLGRDCERLVYRSRDPTWPKAMGWLEIAEHNPDRNVRGRACLTLGLIADDLADIARYIERNPIEAKPGVFLSNMLGGEEQLRDLLRQKSSVLAKRAEAQFHRVIDEYPDVLDRNGARLGEVASGRLAEARDVSIGRVAPEIEGHNLRGERMTLADHRGKVVVVTFWGTWCGPCMALVPEEKALVAKMAGKPFALLGVNTDGDPKEVERVTNEQGMTWPSWHDGGNVHGPISTRWHVRCWPSVYVLDRQGVIRWKRPDFPHRESLEGVVEGVSRQTEPTR